jgi:WD40 repeat protein
VIRDAEQRERLFHATKVMGPAADIYALGAILFELLTGRPPFVAESPLETVLQVLHDEPVSVTRLQPTVPRDLETICHRCIQKEPRKRYATALELAEDLHRFLSGEPIRARPVSQVERLARWCRRKPAQALLAAALLAVVLIAFVAVTWKWREAAYQRHEAEHNAQLATDEKQKALYQTYRARIAAAAAAVQNHDVQDAARHLQEAPVALRDWEWRHLHSRLDDSSAVQSAPTGCSLFLVRSPGGLRIATFDDTGAHVADLDGRQLLQLSFHPREPRGCVVQATPHGLWVLDKSGDGPVRLLDEGGNARVSFVGGGDGNPSALAMSPDGARVAIARQVAEGDRCIGLYDTSSGLERARCTGRHTARITSLAFSADGTRLASASDDFTAQVWDVTTGEWIAQLNGHTSKVLRVTFRPDGTRLATASSDGTVRQWDPKTGREMEPPYKRHIGDVAAVAYSPDGQWIASAGTDRTVRVWRAASGQEAAVLHGHTGTITDVAFAPDGRRLASVSQGDLGHAGYDNSVRIWDVNTSEGLPVLRGHTSYVYPVACSPDGQWIASGSWEGKVRLWDALTGEPCGVLRLGNIVRTLAFGPDSTWLATGCDDDGQLQIWEVATCRLRKVLRGPGRILSAVAVSPDGARIAAVAPGGPLSVVEVSTGREVFRLDEKRYGMRTVANSPDGRWLAGSLEYLKTVYLWDAHTHQLAGQFPPQTGVIHAIAFSPDSRRLVTAGEDRIVRIWDVGTRKCQLERRGHTDAVFAAAFHPSGTRLATAGGDRAVWLWDLAEDGEVARFPGHTNYVWSLAFSPDGKTLVSGSGDQTVRLWDTEPLRVRHEARRAIAALRPEAERLVGRLFREKQESRLVAQSLREDNTLSDLLRRAAIRVLQLRGQADPSRPTR